MDFEFVAFDKEGATVSGTIDATDKAAAIAKLKEKGLFVKQVQLYTPKQPGLFLSQGVTLKDKAFLTQELALLLESGLHVDRGVKLLAETVHKPALKSLLMQIHADLKNGRTLSQAFGKHEHVFDALYINLLQIAENTGALPNVLKGLSQDLSYRMELSSKISQAISYPLVILVVCILSLLFIFNIVVPNMASMFQGQDHLPIYTQLLLNASSFMQQYQWWLFAGLAASAWFFKKSLRNKHISDALSKVLLRIPLVGTGIYQSVRIRFNDALALMLKSGVPIDRALVLASQIVSNPQIRAELEIATDKIKRGQSLSTALGQTKVFPVYFASILAVGEEAGQLAKVFSEIAQRSRNQFNQWVTKMTSILEPVLILGMGLIVGSVVVIMMLSITATTDLAL